MNKSWESDEGEKVLLNFFTRMQKNNKKRGEYKSLIETHNIAREWGKRRFKNYVVLLYEKLKKFMDMLLERLK